jgi:hypothetical protein
MMMLGLEEKGIHVTILPSLGSVQFAGQRVTAKDIEIVITVTDESLPSMKIIGKSQPFRRKIPFLTTRGSENYIIPFPILSAASLESASNKLDRLVMVEGQWRYDNGFGDVVRTNICYGYFGYNNTRYGSQGFRECEFLRSALDEATRIKQETDSAQK